MKKAGKAKLIEAYADDSIKAMDVDTLVYFAKRGFMLNANSLLIKHLMAEINYNAPHLLEKTK